MDRPRRSSSALTLDPGAILREMPVDPSTVEGAQNAVRACLGVEAGQHVVLIVESDCDALGAAFLRAADELGAAVDVHVVDERKATRESFVRTLGEQLAHADASLFVGSIDGIPSSFRRFVISAGGSKRRHGHMPGLTVAMMQQSMRTDYEEVSAITTRLAERLAGDVTITVRAPRGTELVVRCSHALEWHAETGVLREPGWTNLPAGELLTCPSSVDGVLVPDGGMWSTSAQPVKNADRLRVVLEQGRVEAIEGGPGTEPEAILAELDAHENGRRVGQIALGTNVGVVAATGNLLQDLKMPGFHLMLGHTSPEHTGAQWNSPIELPLLVRRADVDVEGTPILRNGRFVAPWV
jgi:leucyl aminopeptidase (aminopeptidase T)